jgi:hypothetical protein
MIVPGASVTKTITVSNTGTSMGDYFSWIEFDFEPTTGTNNYTITYSGDAQGGGVGYPDECTIEVAAKYPLSFYCDKVGTYINKVAFFMRDASADNKLTARVYGGETYNSPGEILAEVTINNPIIGGWNEFTLSEPVLLGGQDIWVAFEMIQPAGGYLMTYDMDTAVENSNWTRRNGGGWSQMLLVQGEPTGILMIKAFTKGSAVPGCWLSLTKAEDTYGSVPMGADKTFNAVFNAEGLTEGMYKANIIVKTNDEANPEFIIPCSLIVGTNPFFEVDITPIFEAIELKDGKPTSITKTITVSNSKGNAEGTFNAVVEGTGEWLTLDGDVTDVLVPAGENKTFDAIFEAEGLEADTYEATIVITTSDEYHAKFEIPCKFIVTIFDGIDGYTIKTLVFPNPANDMVTVQSNTLINSIQVFNNMGQVVYTATVHGEETTINTSTFNAGIYFIKVNTTEGSQNVKLIIN